MDHLKTLSLSELKQFAAALRAKIKEKGSSKSLDSEVQELDKQLEAMKSIIADKACEEAKLEATRRRVAESLKSINPKTYRPQGGKPASTADREIPEELSHRAYVPGETEIGNKPISMDEIFPDDNADQSSEA